MKDKLQQLRSYSGLTQKQLAQYLGVDQSLIAKYENGTRTMSLGIIEKICNLFGCSEEYLFGETNDYSPLNFAFRAGDIQTEDLNCIAAINKIVANLKFMNQLLEEE